MKTNLKGQSGIKGIFLMHGEKIVIVLVGLVALWFVYSTLKLPKLEDKYQASNLQTQITQTDLKVKDTKWPEPNSPEAELIRESHPIEQKRDISVPPALIEFDPRSLNPPVIAPTILRTDPQLVNAIDVQAKGGSGLLSFNDPDVLKRFQIEEARKLDVETRERDAEAKKNAEMQPNELERRPRNRGRGRGGPEEFVDEVVDPDNPHRRQVAGMIQAAGVPLTGGERIDRAFWAMVVAKVPVKEQARLFEDAFQNAKGGYDPTRDYPQYIGYQVERAEVAHGKPLAWKLVPVYDGQQTSLAAKKPIHAKGMNSDLMTRLRELAQKFWAGGGQTMEPVDPRYIDFLLTFPLPPLVGRNWGADATHPDIPLAINALPEEMEEVSPEGAPEDPATEEEGDLDFSAGVTPQTPGGQFAGPEGFAGGGMNRMPPGGFGRSPMIREFAGGPEGGPGFGSFGMPGQTAGARPVEFKLFRFFDFTVEPGKKYKYRVKLVLQDPNYGVDRANLAPEVLDRKQTVARMVDDWSAPSPTVGIPLAGGVRLAAVKPKGEKFNDEPSVSLLVDAFDVDEEGVPIQAATETTDVRRGSVANVVADASYLESNGQFTNKREGFKFQTGMTLLDVAGGEKLPGTRDITTPARVMLMGPAGELYIRNELDDLPAVEYHRQLFSEDETGMGEGAMGFGPEGPMRPGPMQRRPRR